MDNWMEMQRFYNAWKEELNSVGEIDNFGFTSFDEKHHLFIFRTDEYSDDGSYEWYIEVNEVVDGGHEPIDTTFAPIDDDMCLMVQIAWCIERFW